MIKLFRDDEAKSIFIEDNNGAQFPNSLQATKNSDNTIAITDLARNIEIVSSAPYTEFVNQNSASYGTDPDTTVNALNAEFSASGTATAELPVITSGLFPDLTEGNTLNYELTADYGVGYEWDLSNVPGITTVDGNPRKLIGGSGLSVGTYNIPVKAINYNGEDSKTILLTVDAAPFANTKSIKFSNQDWLGANAVQVEHVLGRTGNGSGSSEAWTISFWYKASSDSQGQVVLYYGHNDTTNNGYIEVRQTTSNNQKRLRLRYGSNNNYLQLTTPQGSLTPGTWQHVVISYDGGTTGASSGSLNNYYNRFKIYIDNSLQSTTNTHANYGWSGSIEGINWRVGRQVSGSYMRQAYVDELALFDSDESSAVATLYNSGVPFDLSTLSTQPKHWWRMGDGDTYPNLQDNGTENNCTFVMNNMTAADIVSDTP
tara:strand:- start:35449 stop:36735 length:1287 start_codon:yes stop_codon:yes gene_type:complete